MASSQVSAQTIEQNKELHRAKFEEWLATKEKKTSKVLDLKGAEAILDVIQGRGTVVDSNFKTHVKNAHYNVTHEDGKEVLRRNFKNQNLPVAIKENFFDILYSVHSVQRGHVGIRKIHQLVQLQYYGKNKYNIDNNNSSIIKDI
jgi:flagellar basal body rod protein FlgG